MRRKNCKRLKFRSDSWVTMMEPVTRRTAVGI